jgi:transglutaminase-like putative cysteine protease
MPWKYRPLLVLLAVSLLTSLAHGQQAPIPAAERVDFSLRYDISSAVDTRKITLTISVPADIENRQKIVRKKYSIAPEKEIQENGSTYARIVVNNPPRSLKLTIDCEAILYRYDLETALAQKGKSKAEGRLSLAPFLAEEKYLEVTDTAIQKAAKSIPGKDNEQGVRSVMDFVVQTLKKTAYDPADHGAVWALQNRHGDCTEFTDLFVTLCRAKGIPARACDGYITTEVQKNDTAKHSWTEVYLDKLGWVPFDPLHTFLKIAAVDRLRPVYVQFGHQRVDKTLNGYHFNAWNWEGGAIKVQDSFAVTKRKAEAGK